MVYLREKPKEGQVFILETGEYSDRGIAGVLVAGPDARNIDDLLDAFKMKRAMLAGQPPNEHGYYYWNREYTAVTFLEFMVESGGWLKDDRTVFRHWDEGRMELE